MDDSSEPLIGLPGTDATSSKRGYYYQDILSALAWTKLDIGQELHIELAEDFAIATPDHAEVAQIKDVSASLTLVTAMEHLDRFLSIREANPNRELSFVYVTTATIGQEQRKYRPARDAGITYWSKVQAGADPAPLIGILRSLARPDSRLHAFLQSHDDEKIVGMLIKKVTWAVRSPEAQYLKSELQERVAHIAREEGETDPLAARRLWTGVLDAITATSTRKALGERILTYAELRELIRDLCLVALPKKQYTKLLSEAESSKNPPTQLIDSDILRRIEHLRQTRFFYESNVAEQATSLAAVVKEGGICQQGSRDLRARALCWCARVILEENESLAQEFLKDAASIAEVEDSRFVRALLEGKADKSAALKMIALERGATAESVRYAIRRRGAFDAIPKVIEEAGIEPSELDEGGRCIVLMDLLRGENWDQAVAWLEKIPVASFDEMPALLWCGAHVLVAWAAAKHVRAAVLYGPPIGIEIPLRDDPPAVLARRKSSDLFGRFIPVAEGWGLTGTAQLAQEYRLWLMLEDRASRPVAVAEVSRLWKESAGSSRWIPLAIRARLEIDIDELSDRMDRQALRYGSLTLDDARARVALLCVSSAEKWADKWSTIEPNLRPYIGPSFLEQIYIRALLQLGRLDAARDELSRASHLTEAERKLFEHELSGSNDKSLAEYKVAAESEGSASALHNLISALERAGNLAEASTIARRKYDQTREHEDAEGYLHLLAKQGRWAEILAFLEQHQFLLDQSLVLTRLQVDALIRFGQWDRARPIIENSSDLKGDRRELLLQLAVMSGQWDRIGRLLEDAYSSSAELSGPQLIRLAGVATNLGNVQLAKRLVRQAVAKSPDDASVCLGAYMLAVQGAWEDDPSVKIWFSVAMASADMEGGPMRKGSLSELIEEAPKWREQTENLAQMVSSANMFMALTAQYLNRPLANLIVGTSLTNEGESDFRKLSPIPAFSGVERESGDTAPNVVLLDATALLTLGRLKLLERVANCFEKILLPHSIGHWLFTETSKVRFHQPAKITEAKRLLHMRARGVRILNENLGYSRALAEEVGRDLAELVHGCKEDMALGKNAFVIRSLPLYRTGSLLTEQANLGADEGLFRSLGQVVRSLFHFGLILEESFDEASNYLSRVELSWPGDQLIPLGSTLYLDQLTVTYCQHLGLFRSLIDAKFDLVIHRDVQIEAVDLSALEEINESVGDVIDSIRRFYVEGQAKGIVSVLPLPVLAENKKAGREVEVTASVLLSQMFESTGEVEVIIFDDRGANIHASFTQSDARALPLCTSINVLDWMRDNGQLDEREWLRCRTSLRRSGYLFVPVTTNEILQALEGSTVHDGQLFESVAAKAIRENRLLAQASGMLLLPQESPWLFAFHREVAAVVMSLWNSDEPIDIVGVKSAWLVELTRLDGFADRILGDVDETRFVTLDALTILRFLFSLEIKKERRAAYNTWLDDTFLLDSAQARPRVFESLCQAARARLLDLHSMPLDATDQNLSESEQRSVSTRVVLEFISSLPESIRDVLTVDQELLSRLGLKRESVISAGASESPTFDAAELYAKASLLHGGTRNVTVLDKQGNSWSLSIGDEGVAVCSNDASSQVIAVPHSPLVSPAGDERVQYLHSIAREFGLGASDVQGWIAQLMESPLDSSGVSQLDRDFQDSPYWRTMRITGRLHNGNVSIADLVPTSRKYFERLVPKWRGQTTILDFASGLTGTDISQWSLMQRLVWSSHSAVALNLGLLGVSADLLENEFGLRLEVLDIWSLVGLIENLSTREDGFTGLIDLTRKALEQFSRLMEEPARLELTVALVAIVDGSVNAAGILRDVPVFWRRLATISQAGVLESAIVQSPLVLESFTSWATGFWPLFQATSLADMQTEPRWAAFMLSADQLRQEFLGRVLNAIHARQSEIIGTELYDLVFGEDDRSLKARCNPFFSGLPGPLEGGEATGVPLPEHLEGLTKEALEDDSLPLVRRVMAAAQLSALGAPSPEVLSLLTNSVSRLDLAVLNEDDEDVLATLLIKLAIAAASYRSSELASSVRHLVLDYHDLPLPLKLHAGLMACASEVEPSEWRTAIAQVLAMCTTMARDRGDVEYTLFVLRALCDARPELKPQVARTYARLVGQAKRLS